MTAIRFTQLETSRFPAKPLHLAVGMFDGVHLGHQAVIETAVQSAHRSRGICGVLTFWPHPSRLFKADNPVCMIMSPEIKAEVLASHQVEYVVQQAFDTKFAGIEAEALVTHLKRYMPNLSSLHVGSNWRFGKRRAGDVPMLVRLGREAGVHVVSVERVFWDGEPISSTRIRRNLEAGDLDTANALLGDVYFSIGTVIEGKKLGGKVGFPTLNLPWSPELKPPFGVYCVEVERIQGGGTAPLKAVANFGLRPTVENTDIPLLEVHVLEDCPFSAGDTLKVRWFRFIRPERKFAGIEALQRQIRSDLQTARDFWG